MQKLTGAAAAVILISLTASCSKAGDPERKQPPQGAVADHAALQQQREDFKTRIGKAGGLHIPALDCAARRVSARTVETMYLIWINERGDLTSAADRDDASLDAINAIEACGASMTALAAELQDDDQDLVPKGLAMAMLLAGR